MERRILKDFHIGSVENTVEQFKLPKEEEDIFTQLAKAIKTKKSEKRKRKDWNVLVKRHSLERDPIGSTKEFEKVLQNRRSIRKVVGVPKSHSTDSVILPGKLTESRPNKICKFGTQSFAFFYIILL